ncbi:MAG TPA: hypothetical protein VK783_10995 [Bacteroidia bacterium]|jgi:DNA-directed RNA polymerase specialized sigma24 family protein|nr:hypothetical protein [Bacteroidia bacterium]
MNQDELNNEPTENLIEYIRWKDDPTYLDLAKKACYALIFRFQNDIMQKCRTICPKWGYSETIADMIAEKVFERFFKYPNGFDIKKGKKSDINTCVRLYLYQIARRLLIDKKNEDEGIGLSPYDGTEEVIKEIDVDNIDASIETKRELRKRCELIDKALSSLTPKHKTIFLTYQTHQQKGHQMPRGLLKKLRIDLELTQSSIQVYKKEAFDTFNKYLEIYGR